MKLWSWDKKPSTSKGRLKRGDIFCFAYNEQTYCFGRIIELDPKKHMCIVEIFDHISDRPEIDEETVLHAGRMIPPLNANFDNFEGGTWRIIGQQEDYYAPDYNEIYVVDYVDGELSKIDFHGNATAISQNERKQYINLANPHRDKYVKPRLLEWIAQKQYASVLADKNYPTDPEEFYRFVDTMFDARRFNDVIDAILTIPEDKQDRRSLAALLGSYNNSEQYDNALKCLEKYKHLYGDKMRIWYYYATYAYLGKKDYENAGACIDGGFAECEREKTAGTLGGRDYDLEIADFKNLQFRWKSALEELEKRKGNFSIDEDKLKCYYDDGVTTDVVIPDGIKELGSRAFEGCTTIRSVIIPESVTEIDTDVFTGCSNLEKIQFPSHISIISKNPCILEDTKWFQNQPKGQIIIGDCLYAYTGEEEEVAIKDTVYMIASEAFKFNTKLRKVVIPSSVKIMQSDSFSGCTNLETVEIAEGVETIGSYAFKADTKLRKVVFPSSIKRIGADAFHGCTNLETVDMPDGVETIGSCAFKKCEKIKEMILPSGLVTIAYGAFEDCKNLREVSIPAGTKNAYEEIFSGATSIQKITIANPKLILGHDAFGNKEKYPEALYKNSPELPLHLTDGDIKQYIDFDKLPEGIQALMFVKRQSKSLASYYQKYITVNNARTISNYITELTKTKLSAKEKKNAELFFTQYGALI